MGEGKRAGRPAGDAAERADCAGRPASSEAPRRLRPDECGSIVGAHSCYESLLRAVINEHRSSLTKTQTDTIHHLSFAGPLGMTDLSRRLGVSKEQATRAVAPLVERGYVARERDAGNRRAVNVSLTEAGEALMNQMKAEYDALLDRKLSALSDEDLARFVALSSDVIALLCDPSDAPEARLAAR